MVRMLFVMFILMHIVCINCRYVTLKNLWTGMYLDAFPRQNSNYQLWKQLPVSDTPQTFQFAQKATDQALDGGYQNNVYINSVQVGNPYQEWRLSPVYVNNNTYYIFYNNYTGLVMDAGGSNDNIYLNKFMAGDEYQYWEMKTFTTTTTTSTTIPPIDDCLFHSNNHSLNLTLFQGEMLADVDSKNNELLYAITPCGNGLICNNRNVNAYLYNISSQKCDKYLSIWNDGNVIIPKYDLKEKIWQFIYTNGEECNGLESDFEVYWVCDPKQINNPDIVYVNSEYECSYSMFINTSAACN